MTGKAHESASNGAAFAASFQSDGKAQSSMTAHVIVMPGGIMLIDEAVKLETLKTKPCSGPIHCNNGRD